MPTRSDSIYLTAPKVKFGLTRSSAVEIGRARGANLQLSTTGDASQIILTAGGLLARKYCRAPHHAHTASTVDGSGRTRNLAAKISNLGHESFRFAVAYDNLVMTAPTRWASVSSSAWMETLGHPRTPASACGPSLGGKRVLGAANAAVSASKAISDKSRGFKDKTTRGAGHAPCSLFLSYVVQEMRRVGGGEADAQACSSSTSVPQKSFGCRNNTGLP